MTWGTHCPQCGREDCKWVCGEYCDGNTRGMMPVGTRLRYCEYDFDVPGVFWYAEHKVRGWLRDKWVELRSTRGDSPQLVSSRAALALARKGGE